MKTLKCRIGLSFGVGVALVFTASTASADLIVNGDFEAGNTGFTSGYTYVANPGLYRSGPGGMWIEGTYTIDTNPNNDHALWTGFGDHTTGSGNMMIVNGSPTPNTTVWSETIPLSAGTYTYTAWVANTYPASPANLQLSLNGSASTTFTPTGNGQWNEWTYTFTVPSDQNFTIVDMNLALSGNDFALDDISLTRVPDGGITALLLGMGMLALQYVRRMVK